MKAEPTNTTTDRPGVGRVFSLLAMLGLFGVGTATLLTFGAHRFPTCELATHFRMQYCISALIVILLSTVRRRWTGVILASALLIWHGRLVTPYYGPVPGPINSRNPSNPIRIASINLYGGNRNANAVKRFLDDSAPDIVALQECSPFWGEQIAAWKGIYPHQKILPRSDHFGIGVISRHQLESARVIALPENIPMMLVEVVVNDRRLTILSAHPVPPGGRRTQLRDEQLRMISGVVKHLDGPIILAGDLNCTPFSPAFDALIAATELRDGRLGFGVCPSWPSGRWPLQIPIDHCLVSEGIAVTSFRIGPDVGSDHLPVVMECRVKN